MPRIVFYKIGNTVFMDKSGGAQSGMKRKKIMRGSSYQMSDREEENAVLPGGKSFIEPEQCSEETVSADRSSEEDVQTSLGADALSDPADKAKRAKRLVIVVGASSGIGYETALRLIGRGFAVSNISRTPCRLDQVKNYTADVAEEGALEKAIAEAAAQTENLYALVYCAGFSMAAPIEYAEEKDYRYLFDVNYFGAIRAIKGAVPLMKKRGGRIVVVSSMGGLFPIAFDSFYSSSKAAVDMLVKSAAIELEPYNIRVSAVRPGGTSTGFTFKRKIYGDEANGEYAPNVKRAAAVLADMEQEGMSAGEVAKSVADVVCEKNPPLLLQCGGWNKFYAVAKRVLPDKAAQYISKKVYKQ